MKTSLPMLFDKLSASAQPHKVEDWRKILIRDVERLLNDASRSADLFLQDYMQCERSVLNYGLPSLSKKIENNVDVHALAQCVRKIIVLFEPRLDPKTVRVVPVLRLERSYAPAILFDIQCTCSLPSYGIEISLRVALDYSCSAVRVID